MEPGGVNGGDDRAVWCEPGLIFQYRKNSSYPLLVVARTELGSVPHLWRNVEHPCAVEAFECLRRGSETVQKLGQKRLQPTDMREASSVMVIQLAVFKTKKVVTGVCVRCEYCTSINRSNWWRLFPRKITWLTAEGESFAVLRNRSPNYSTTKSHFRYRFADTPCTATYPTAGVVVASGTVFRRASCHFFEVCPRISLQVFVLLCLS